MYRKNKKHDPFLAETGVNMASPFIGVTSNLIPGMDGKMRTVSLGEAYIQAVIQAGGIPVIVPVGIPKQALGDLFAGLDGLLFTGGGDIHPERFHGQAHPRVYGIDEHRDELEISLVLMAVETGKPFFGICRGIQVINVALGGSLYTDIADQAPGALRHDYFPDIPRDYLAHPVSVLPECKLAQIMDGEIFEVNSLHHQGIDILSSALRPVAFSPDSLVEAVELPGHPFGLAVQWHPEWLQAHIAQRRLFQALVRAASER
jgi:putative glutamine amidotransferase